MLIKIINFRIQKVLKAYMLLYIFLTLLLVINNGFLEKKSKKKVLFGFLEIRSQK